MAFDSLPGFIHTAPIDWHEDAIEMVCSGDETGIDTYIEPVEINGATTLSPIQFMSASQGTVDYSRAFGGEWPQINLGLDAAWQRARYGFSETVLWPDAGSDLNDDGLGSHSYHGAAWSLNAEIQSTAPGNGVTARSTISGWHLEPEVDLFDSWTSQFFTWPGNSDPEPTLAAEFDAAVEANRPPGDGWIVQWESFYPIFLGYQIAGDELVAGNAIYSGIDPSGDIYVGKAATGWGVVAPVGEGDYEWVGPGGYSTPYYFTYGGGAGGWNDVPDEWMPTQDLETGLLNAPEVPKIALNCYIDFYQSQIDGSDIIPALGSIAPNGFDIHLGAGRTQLTFAVKMFWKPPRFRFIREVIGVIRQYPRDDEQGWGSGTRLYPPTKAGRTVGGIQ